MSGVVAFYADGLLDKHGFADGDLLFELVESHCLSVDHRELLTRAIEDLVVPLLDQDVETHVVATLHNPVRVHRIDGERADPFDTLTPEIIEIPVSDIVALALVMSATRGDHQ